MLTVATNPFKGSSLIKSLFIIMYTFRSTNCQRRSLLGTTGRSTMLRADVLEKMSLQKVSTSARESESSS